jgi:hypothetical protein
MAVNINIMFFWDVMLWSLTVGYQCSELSPFSGWKKWDDWGRWFIIQGWEDWD